MTKARYMAAVLFAATAAQAQWSSWPTNWSHRTVRSNLWAALNERIIAAYGDAYHITNPPAGYDALAAPGWWVSKGWLDGFDTMLTNVAAQYVDPVTLTNKAYNASITFDTSNVLARGGWTGLTNLPSQGWWFPTFTNYLVRKGALNAMTNTYIAATWAAHGQTNAFGNLADNYGTGTNWIEALWDAETNESLYGVFDMPPQVYVKGFNNSGVTFDAWFVTMFADATNATASSTNYSKAAAFWWAGKIDDATEYGSVTFNDAGVGIVSNFWRQHTAATNIGYGTAINFAQIGETNLVRQHDGVEPASGTNSWSGFIAEGAILWQWTADTNGFKYR